MICNILKIKLDALSGCWVGEWGHNLIDYFSCFTLFIMCGGSYSVTGFILVKEPVQFLVVVYWKLASAFKLTALLLAVILCQICI